MFLPQSLYVLPINVPSLVTLPVTVYILSEVVHYFCQTGITKDSALLTSCQMLRGRDAHFGDATPFSSDRRGPCTAAHSLLQDMAIS